jgi:acylphosphatase
MKERTQPKARLHAIVHGHVQGVNFRYHTSRTAQSLGLTGWVANRWDGTVEAVAEGQRQSLEKFLAFLHQGPPVATVLRVDAAWEPASGEFEHFRVRYL